MYRAVILPLAKQDIKKAAQWYEGKQKGLGKRFVKEVRNKVSYISSKPNAPQYVMMTPGVPCWRYFHLWFILLWMMARNWWLSLPYFILRSILISGRKDD